MLLQRISLTCFDNDLDAYVPELWAQETLALLEENMVISNLIHTDFSSEIQEFGDVVNTRIPTKLEAFRKGANDDVTVQNAEATNVAIPLNQHIHTSFLIRDLQETISLENMRDRYLTNAALAIRSQIDRILLGQAYQFLDNSVGILGTFASTDAKSRIIATRKKMSDNLVPEYGRYLILGTETEATCLELDLFNSADKIGDDGTALREASLGRKLGFDIYTCQNTAGTSVAAGTGNADELAAAAVVGDTALTLDAGVLNNGQYFWLEGDGQPLRVASGGGTTSIVSNRALKADVAAAASNLFAVTEGTVDLAGHTGVTAYPAGYAKLIKVDGTGTPHLGQLVAFSTVGSAAAVDGEYCITYVDSTNGYIQLDRPLDSALLNNYVVNYGPRGDYNFAFDRGALAMLIRPLAVPMRGTGGLGAVASYNGLSIRITITYLGTSQGHLVTLDTLCGVKVLDVNRGAVLLGGNYTESYT